MNVLILTPDAVGSTLLQRMLTIYMQFHNFDQPVINLHELTNSLEKYYSPQFNREIVSKKAVKNWGYHQSLKEIVELLSSVDHYKTSRLAHYHIQRRSDGIEQQVPFYNYLNENFYIISCRRTNVFEHALSMCLSSITKKLNVFLAYEKIDAFYEIYQSKVEISTQGLIYQLNAYRDYIKWSDQYFNVSSYFNYEQDVPRLEEFILGLPVFKSQIEKITWEKHFGITFNLWNKMHYARSDIGSIALDRTKQDIQHQILTNSNNQPDNTLLVEYQNWQPRLRPRISDVEGFNNLPITVKNQFACHLINQDGILPLLNAERQNWLSQHKQSYTEAQHTIDQMIKLGILISGPPIKKQTLQEKQKIISNFDQLTDVYNQWAANNLDICSLITNENLQTQQHKEFQFWNSIDSNSLKLN
jgi:hypothetical protein